MGTDISKFVAEAIARYEAICEAQRRTWVVGEMMLAYPTMTLEEALQLYKSVR